MSQTFATLNGTDTLTASRTVLNDNFNSLKTRFSGTSTPFTATAATLGAEYYNTNDLKTYRVIKQGNNYVWTDINTIVPTAAKDSSTTIGANTEFVSKAVNRTNCITEIAKDINLELSGGTLTLKSGSIITAPNGTQRATTQDQTTSINTDGQYLLFVAATNGSFQLNGNHTLDKIGSGSSLPADGSTYEFFFNTSDQTIYRWRSSLTTWVGWAVALPIGIITASGGSITSIDQVFNGVGFIGSTVFALPGVKGLIPNGRNPDGTLKNTAFTISSLLFNNVSGTNHFWLRMATNYLGFFTSSTYYDEELNNVIYNNTVQSQAQVGTIDFTNGTITSFMPKTTFHSVDYWDLEQEKNKVSTLDSQNVKKTGSNTVSANNTWSGSNTFFGNVSLGSNATAVSPDYFDSDTSVATTAMVSNRIITMTNTYLTKIPQDIKLENSNGSLVLKTGSVITAPNGTQYTTQSDFTINPGAPTGQRSILIGITSGGSLTGFVAINGLNLFSGTTAPTVTVQTAYWLDTTNNVIKRTTDTGSTWAEIPGITLCLPVCLVTFNAGTLVSIDQVFNGAGYIGHHAFILPGISYVCGNGLDDRGNSKSFSNTLNTLSITELQSSIGIAGWFRAVVVRGNANNVAGPLFCRTVKTRAELLPVAARIQQVIDDNLCYVYNSSTASYDAQSRLLLIKYEYDGTTVSSFELQPTLHLATTEMLYDVDSTTVKTSGNQTINGTLTTSGGVTTSVLTVTGNAATQHIELVPADGQLTITAPNGVKVATPSSATDYSTLAATTEWKTKNDNTFRTNCITKIPQDIKLELNNGTLTVKAGTSFYTAGGSQYSLASDVTVGVGGANAPYFIFPQTGGNVGYAQVSACYSGSTEPTGIGQNALWLDTTNKVIKYTSDSGSTWSTTNNGLPIAICTPNSGSWASIDQVFNGFGYIGSTVFILPGVSGLSPGGFNDDGTLENKSITVDSLILRTQTTASLTNKHFGFTSTGIAFNTFSYNKEENILYDAGGNARTNTVFAGDLTFDSVSPYKVTNFNVKPVFRIVDYAEFIQTDEDNAKKSASQTFTGANTFTGTVALGSSATATTQPVTDDSTSIATTAYVSSKFQYVTELPASPISGVFYFVKET